MSLHPLQDAAHWSERFEEAGRDYAKRGIRLAGVELDLPAMMAEKERTVSRLAGGVARLFEGNGVERVRGAARLVRVEGRPAVAVNGAGGERIVSARRVVIATGSSLRRFPASPWTASGYSIRPARCRLRGFPGAWR